MNRTTILRENAVRLRPFVTYVDVNQNSRPYREHLSLVTKTI